MTLINIYALTEDKEDEIKEQFYEELQRTQDRVPKHDIIIIMGDMNAKFGKEKVFSQAIGRHTLHNISNENGEMVANYAISNGMFLISTNFQHKKIHIGMWISPDHQTINQIDHVMVSKEKMRLIHDVRSKRGYNCDSGHFLVQIKIKQKLITVNNRQTQKYKWDRQLFNQKEKIIKYQEKIQSKLQEIEEETDINQDWQNLNCTRKTIHPTYMDTGEKQFEQVNSFKYLGAMVNTDNSIEEEIKERIAAGNRAYHVHKKLFTSKLISRNVKLYNTLIRPTVKYASETWVLKENMINKLMIFERKIMRKILGPTRLDDGYWRIKTNQEINDILKGQNIIGFIKKQRLNWLGHVERMAEDNNVQKINRWKPMSKRPIGRPKKRWDDDVLEDIKSMNVRNWKNLAQNRDRWKKVVEQARTLNRL